MPAPINWTADIDVLIKRLRSEGFSWDHIANKVGISRFTVAERGRLIGAELPPKGEFPDIGDDREPLPAGSAVSWGAINAGTCLEGSDYPSYQPEVRRSARALAVLALGMMHADEAEAA